MNVLDTPIEGLKIIEPRVFGDDRGYFMETWNQNTFRDHGIDENFVQDNESQSVQGTLRGLHFQKDQPQGKLVRAVRGEVFDVAVDLRLDSPTYGQWFGLILSEENKRQFWIPKGFGHGYYTISDVAVFSYKCNDFYAPNDQWSLHWQDPDVGIEWPLVEGCEVLLSEKDAVCPSFKEITEILKG